MCFIVRFIVLGAVRRLSLSRTLLPAPLTIGQQNSPFCAQFVAANGRTLQRVVGGRRDVTNDAV